MKMAAASSVYPDQEATKSRISCSKAASLYRLKLAPPDLQQTQEREMLLSQLGQIQPCSYLGTKLGGSGGAHRHILGLVSTLLGIPHRLCCSSLGPHCVPMKRLVGQHRRATQPQTKDVTVGRAIPGGFHQQTTGMAAGKSTYPLNTAPAKCPPDLMRMIQTCGSLRLPSRSTRVVPDNEAWGGERRNNLLSFSTNI